MTQIVVHQVAMKRTCTTAIVWQCMGPSVEPLQEKMLLHMGLIKICQHHSAKQYNAY